MGAKLLKENAAATQASTIMQNEEHRGKKGHKIHMKRKLLYFEREMTSVLICQALETVFVIFLNKTVLMLLRKKHFAGMR